MTTNSISTVRINHGSSKLLIAALASVSVCLSIVVLSPDASAQGYPAYPAGSYTTYQSYGGHQAQPWRAGRVRPTHFYFVEDYPVVGRTMAGGGSSYGAIEGVGYNLEGALSFRLESEDVYSVGHVYIIPEIGFSMIHHAVLMEDENTGDQHLENEHYFLFGMGGLRLGFGYSEIGDLYVLGRILVGSHQGEGMAAGFQYGLGAEVFHGIFGVELSHVVTYAPDLGTAHGLRVTANLDVVRGVTSLFALVLDGIGGC